MEKRREEGGGGVVLEYSELWIKLHSQCPQRGKKENEINRSICLCVASKTKLNCFHSIPFIEHSMLKHVEAKVSCNIS